MGFLERLRSAQDRNESLLCLGLDPDPDRLEGRHIPSFLQEIVEATLDQVCAYKVNLAFFEALGPSGMNVLMECLAPVPREVPIIADGKRGDIPNTARFYARALFEVYGFDAVTLNPYGGRDSLEPFLEYEGRGIFIWCRSSNPGAADLQSLPLADGRPLYLAVAEMARSLADRGEVGLVVGATAPGELARVRQACPELPILVPGIGPQGGDLAAALAGGLDAQGGGVIITVSRQVLYASSGRDFARAARRQAEALRDEINRRRAEVLVSRRGG
jgi:orotidine-5'-phosphate decarboxylase